MSEQKPMSEGRLQFLEEVATLLQPCDVADTRLLECVGEIRRARAEVAELRQKVEKLERDRRENSVQPLIAALKEDYSGAIARAEAAEARSQRLREALEKLADDFAEQARDYATRAARANASFDAPLEEASYHHKRWETWRDAEARVRAALSSTGPKPVMVPASPERLQEKLKSAEAFTREAGRIGRSLQPDSESSTIVRDPKPGDQT